MRLNLVWREAFFAWLSVWIFGSACLCMGEATIDFSHSTNLRTIYDAGLRPWRVRPDEKHSLNLTDQKISVVFPGGGRFSMDVQIADISVLEENEIDKVEFISRPMPLDQVLLNAEQACSALEVNAGGLRKFVDDLRRMGDQVPYPQMWNGRGTANGCRYSVTISPLFGMSETRGKIFVTIEFNQRGKSVKFLTEPIKPPQGYEHISMAPPVLTSASPFPDPAYSAEAIAARAGRASGLGTNTASLAIDAKSPAPDMLDGAEIRKSKISLISLFGFTVVVLVVIGIAWVLVARWRR